MHVGFTRAIEAVRSKPKDARTSYHVGAALVRGKAVVSTGVNTVARAAWHSKLVCAQDLHGVALEKAAHLSTHAEMVALYAAISNGVDPKGLHMYVVRLCSTGLALAKPCLICQRILFRHGVRTMSYTVNATTFGRLKIRINGQVEEQLV